MARNSQRERHHCREGERAKGTDSGKQGHGGLVEFLLEIEYFSR
jgi:hypothetical protein